MELHSFKSRYWVLGISFYVPAVDYRNVFALYIGWYTVLLLWGKKRGLTNA